MSIQASIGSIVIGLPLVCRPITKSRSDPVAAVSGWSHLTQRLDVCTEGITWAVDIVSPPEYTHGLRSWTDGYCFQSSVGIPSLPPGRLVTFFVALLHFCLTIEQTDAYLRRGLQRTPSNLRQFLYESLKFHSSRSHPTTHGSLRRHRNGRSPPPRGVAVCTM